MSEYTFKNLNEIDNVAEPADGTTVMGFENGTPIQMPMSAIKGSSGVFIIDKDDPEYSETDTVYGNKVKEALLSGKQVWLYSLQKSTTVESPYEAIVYTCIYNFVINRDLNTNAYSLILPVQAAGVDILTLAITVD